MHESKKYDSNIFVTLTYSPDNLPADRSILKREVQLFLKRLRKAIAPRKVRFFASGEYGERYSRPHYHLILFGLSKLDRPVVEKAWGKGFVDIGDVTPDSANYVAKYTVKKMKGRNAADHYKSLGIQPEFALMSRRPGIGQDYVEQNAEFLKQHEFVVLKGKKYRIPRYYEERLFFDDHDHKMAKQAYMWSQLMADQAERRKKKVNPKKDIAERREQEDLNLRARLVLKKGKLNG